MKFTGKQCKECPFKKSSARGWLGDYTVGEVFSSIWKGQPFFCHSQIDYEDPDWEKKAMAKGPLCTGSLVFAKKMLAPDREVCDRRLASARLAVLKIMDTVECMEPREFGEHHDVPWQSGKEAFTQPKKRSKG